MRIRYFRRVADGALMARVWFGPGEVDFRGMVPVGVVATAEAGVERVEDRKAWSPRRSPSLPFSPNRRGEASQTGRSTTRALLKPSELARLSVCAARGSGR